VEYAPVGQGLKKRPFKCSKRSSRSNTEASG
jgi:hypothetical protein